MSYRYAVNLRNSSNILESPRRVLIMANEYVPPTRAEFKEDVWGCDGLETLRNVDDFWEIRLVPPC